jgi:hypothetical protein
MRFVSAGILASFAMGCGAAAEEDIDTVQQELGFSAWKTLPTFEAAAQYGPTLVSKNPNFFWAAVVPYSNGLSRNVFDNNPVPNGSWSGWSAQTINGSLGSKPGAVSWLSAMGVDASRNVAMAYVGSDGRVRVGHAGAGAGVISVWNIMNGANDIVVATGTPPALAYAGNYLYLFVRRASDNRVYFKRNNAGPSGYQYSGWPTSWTMIGTEEIMGISAAAVTGNKIAVTASKFDGTNPCRSVVATVSTNAVGAWGSIAGCSLSPWSIPAMTATGANGESGARLVIKSSTNTYATGTSINGTSYTLTNIPSSANCMVPNSNPSVAQYTNGGLLAVGATCDGSEAMRWVSVTP